MYADEVTSAMETAITETQRRREIQEAYNQRHNITPKTVVKEIREVLEISSKNIENKLTENKKLTKKEEEKLIKQLEKNMKQAAKNFEFEKAAYYRDMWLSLTKKDSS